MKLEDKEWKIFKIGDIFTIGTGSLIPKKLLKSGDIPRITATDNNNGVFDFYAPVEHRGQRLATNFISVSFLGSVFYHPYTATLDMKIHSIQIPDQTLNRYLAEFLVVSLKRMSAIFSYGDQLSSTDLPKKKILLPVDSSGKPDYDYMENYMKQIEYKKLKEYIQYKKI